jgi:hypothetical protein
MRHFLLPLLTFLLFTNKIVATNYNVLFIGNSYTAVNDLPNTFKQITVSMGDSTNVVAYTPGATTLQNHANDANVFNLLQQGNWDIIIFQAQSQEPAFPPSQVASNTLPFAKSLDSMAKLFNTCAEVFYYMTWGRKNGDASNCANYPPICTYNGMQQSLRNSYVLMAQQNHSNVCPVGVVWQRVRNIDSNINLYNADESHPSVAGTYLAACAFYTSIFHKATNNTTFLSSGVSLAEAAIIQTASNFIVLDSLENWQQYGTMPRALFTYNNSGPTTINFLNKSKRHTNSKWFFGDGQINNTNIINLSNTYPNATNKYKVTLAVQNDCGKKDIINDSVSITIPQVLQNNLELGFVLNYKNGIITIENEINADKIFIYNHIGQLLFESNLISGQQLLQPYFENSNFVLYTIAKANQIVKSGKLLLQ